MISQKSSKHCNLTGPDFLCVGMQKGGTGFIYECLQNLDSFRMPMRKEIHYFDRLGEIQPGGIRFLRGVSRKLGSNAWCSEDLVDFFQNLKPRWFLKRKIMAGRAVHRIDAKNILFLKKFSLFVHHGPNDQAYQDLFSPYSNYMTGDITPGYSRLGIDEIRRVRELLPGVKIIISVREPVARLWSQLNMGARRQFKEEYNRAPRQSDIKVFDALLSPDRLVELVKNDRYMSRSMATEVYRKWGEVYGQENILIVNFEDLIRRTELVLDKIFELLEVPAQRDIKIPLNIKEKTLKIELDDVRRDIVESALGDELYNFDRAFREHKDRV